MSKKRACGRCGYLNNLEKHHKKRKVDGGSDANPNRRWLCEACHDYQQAKDAVLKAIKAERDRIAILEKRLAIIERENTPDKIRERGYQAYFDLFPEPLPASTKCSRYLLEKEKNDCDK